MPRCELCQPHHLSWVGQDCALAHFMYACYYSPRKQECCGISLLRLSMIHHCEGDIFMGLCLTPNKNSSGFGTSLVFFFFLLPCFPHCLSSFHWYREAALASYEITDSPTLTRIHASPPGIPEQIYSISQQHDCSVPCPFIISYKCTLQLLYQTWWGAQFTLLTEWLKELGVCFRF